MGNTPGSLKGIDVVVLAGGMGTRLRGVLGDTPKVLAPIAGRSFLDYLLTWLEACGAHRIVMSLGHQSVQVLEHLGGLSYDHLDIVPVVEPEPLGTAGALRFVVNHLKSDPVMVMNGDTFIDVNLGDLVADHRATGSDISLVGIQVDSTSRFGRLELDAHGNVQAFLEKSPTNVGAGIVNGGVYLFSRAMLEQLVASTGSSLERDFFAQLPRGSIRAVFTSAQFIDIGIPESLAEAERVIPQCQRAGRPPTPPTDLKGAPE